MVLRRAACLLFLIFLFIPLAPAGAAGVSMEIRAGFDGFYKNNTWVPVRVTVSNEGPGIQAELRVTDEGQYNQGTTQYVYPLDLPAQSRKQIELYLPYESQSDLEVSLVDSSGQRLVSQKDRLEPLGGDDLLVGVIASDPSLLNALAGLNTASGYRVAVAHLALEDLPTVLQPWTSLDILVFNDTDTTRLTPAQHQALQSWLGQGGRLLVGGGPGAGQTIAGLGTLLPFSEVSIQNLPHPLPELQPLAAGSIPDRGPYVAAVPAAVSSGQILAQQEGLPLILRFEHHLGQIYYLALDLGLAPLDLLVGQDKFFPQLLQPFQAQYVYAGNWINYNEMRTSLTYIPNQPLPTPGALTLYLIFYILMVGPVNYLFLRYFKRRDWAWATIPIIVLLFSGVGYLNGLRLRGSRPLVRQTTLVRASVPENTPLAEASAFIGVFSPSRTTYTLRSEPATLVTSIPDSYSTSGDLTINVADSVAVENLAVDIGGMSTLVARTQLPAPQLTANLSYNSQNHQIHGVITNGTGQPIQEAYLVAGTVSLALGTLSEGENPVQGQAKGFQIYDNFYGPPAQHQTTAETVQLASRNSALRAILSPYYNYPNTPLPSPQLYLIGWQEGSPVTIDLPGERFDRQEETLLLITLPFN